MRCFVVILIGACAAASCTFDFAPDPGPRSMAGDPGFSTHVLDASTLIDAVAIRKIVAEIGSDDYEGRGPGTRGDEKARAYIVEQMQFLGLQPGAPGGGWQQEFELVGIESMVSAQWTFGAGDRRLTLRHWDDFIAASGVQARRAEIAEAELVFVGYGIQAPEYDWDDYKGRDMRGKILVMLNNDPDWDEDLFAGVRRLYYGRWMYKYEIAARMGAAGAIIIHTTPSAGYPFQVVQSSWSGAQFELPTTGEPRIQVKAWTTEEAAQRLVRLGGHDLDKLIAAARSRTFKPVALGIHTGIGFDNVLTNVRSANVIGMLPGKDPVLAAEAVVYTTHHDHIGIGKPDAAVDPGDAIYNGARDNASGTGMVLAIARAFAGLEEKPRRSVVFAVVGAEEQGLLGSQFFAREPGIAPGRMAANINYDSGNIWGATRDVTYVGMGKSADLDEAMIRAAAHQNRSVKPDQFPDRGYFYRSDQFNMARIGVPAIYISNGTDFVGRPVGWGVEQINAYTARHYHQPSDELTDDWSFDGMVLDARLGFMVGYDIANATAMPAWNAGDEFEAARKQALDALR